MNTPLILITDFEVAPGRFEQVEKFARDVGNESSRSEPGTLVYSLFARSETEVRLVEYFTSSEAFIEHAMKHMGAMPEFSTWAATTRTTIYGDPTPAVLDGMAAAGIDVEVYQTVAAHHANA